MLNIVDKLRGLQAKRFKLATAYYLQVALEGYQKANNTEVLLALYHVTEAQQGVGTLT